MKKVLFTAALAICGILHAQKFGVTAGMLTGFAKVEAEGMEETDSSTGFYAGVFAEIPAGASLSVQPGVNFVMIDEANAIQIPVMLKYYASPQFNLQFGPQILYDLEDVGELSDYYNKTNFGLALGAGYDFTPKLAVEARYSAQLNDHFKNAPQGYSAKANYLNVGLGYKF